MYTQKVKRHLTDDTDLWLAWMNIKFTIFFAILKMLPKELNLYWIQNIYFNVFGHNN